jgi:hypothetical protein
MDITSLISDLLTRADWLAYSNWDLVHGVLDAIIPDAWSNYSPDPRPGGPVGVSPGPPR